MSLKSDKALWAVLISLFLPVSAAHSQWKDEITLVPLGAQRVASKTREFERFKYRLSSSDLLRIRARDQESPFGSNDTGFVITRKGVVLQRISLRALPSMRREEPDYADSFTSLAIARACGKEGSVFFLTMQYSGDETSPALIFAVVPSARGYRVSAFPMISGGVLEVSSANPFHLRTWDNLHEGECEACETAYQITEYEIRDGKPTRTRQYRTKHQYTSGSGIFDDQRRMRFMP